jgi:metal transporter CNNM
MGQDEVYLQVLAVSGEGSERTNARKVLDLLNKGKHWVLVTLLLGNVITNETLPIMLDRSLGGGWQAVLGSTVLIVIFGEIVPQSVCVRYGLPIGAFMSTFVLVLMWILAPVSWPTAKLLDVLLGQDHGTTYKKAGLKTLVTLHRTLGTSPDDRLNKDEVTIISAVLDLKAKPVGSIMTPMEDVFTLSADTVLDVEMMNTILSEGYSRIPIYTVKDPGNFIGMLLVKVLITYDPEDCLRVDDFQLATLPETRPETSCLDIINFFQEGKSHMILVSEFPGEPHGALGVCTLEDVIEELIGEEIIDESDVFVDVHKAIRRINPVSYYRVPKHEATPTGKTEEQIRTENADSAPRRLSGFSEGPMKTKTAKLTRRRSSGGTEAVPLQREDAELRMHLKHLGPSNLASKPKQTRINTVKIKPGQSHNDSPVSLIRSKTTETAQSAKSHQESTAPATNGESNHSPTTKFRDVAVEPLESTGLLYAGFPANDGVQAVNYGALSISPTNRTKQVLEESHSAPIQPSPLRQIQAAMAETPRIPEAPLPQAQQVQEREVPVSTLAIPESLVYTVSNQSQQLQQSLQPPEQPTIIGSFPAKLIVTTSSDRESAESSDELNPDESSSGNTMQTTRSVTGSERRATRSGSIFERDLDVNGVPKVVLDVHDVGRSDVEELALGDIDEEGRHGTKETDRLLGGGEAGKKKRKKKKSRKKAKAGSSSEAGASSQGASV